MSYCKSEILWNFSLKCTLKVFALKPQSAVTIFDCQEPPFINLMKPSRQPVCKEHGRLCQTSRLCTSSEVNEPLCGLRGV